MVDFVHFAGQVHFFCFWGLRPGRGNGRIRPCRVNFTLPGTDTPDGSFDRGGEIGSINLLGRSS